MNEKPLRKRIYKTDKIVPVEQDDLAYIPNKATSYGRKITQINKSIAFELWHDQHYVTRYTVGDEYGKRDGIEPKIVLDLINRAFPYFIACSFVVKGFRFVNFKDNHESLVRTIIHEQTKDGQLNVIIEVHYVDVFTYEVTVKTGMVKDGFTIKEGEFSLELVEGGVIVRKLDNKVLRQILEL